MKENWEVQKYMELNHFLIKGQRKLITSWLFERNKMNKSVDSYIDHEENDSNY